MDAFTGEIRLVAFNFSPRNWAECNGQLMSIMENQALFALLGTTYGGDGRTTFGLPDLRGRVPVGTGRHPGSQFDWRQGQTFGNELTQLTTAQMPRHSHDADAEVNVNVDVSIPVSTESGSGNEPSGKYLANTGRTNIYADAPSTGASLGATIDNTTASAQVSVGDNGSGQSFSNIPPIQVLKYVICLEGIFPPRT